MRGRPGYPPADRRVAECSDLAALLGSGDANRVPLPAQCPGPADGAFWASRDCPHPASECTLVQVPNVPRWPALVRVDGELGFCGVRGGGWGRGAATCTGQAGAVSWGFLSGLQTLDSGKQL